MRSIDYFDRGHDLDPSRICVIEGNKRYTFASVKAQTEQLASALYAQGFAKQDAVAIYSPNSAESLITLLSIWRAEGRWIPLHITSPAAASSDYLQLVGCQWLFYDSSLAADVDVFQQRMGDSLRCICLDKRGEGHPSLHEFMAANGVPVSDHDGDPFGNLSDIVGVFPTGGTTGPMRGVDVSNLTWGTMIETAAVKLTGRTVNPVNLIVAPISHAAGPFSLATLSFGATQVLLPRFEGAAILDAIAQHRVTHMHLSPSLLCELLDEPRIRSANLRSLKLLFLVGSTISATRLRQAISVFGPCVCQSYGQVECPMFISWLSPEVAAAAAWGDQQQRLSSCGRGTESVRVEIMDEQGRLLANGERGEIVVRGTLVSKGYHKDAAGTEEIRRFGWHHTGDIGYRDNDGYLYIVDRQKDMITTAGYNVFSSEVEAIIVELPDVVDCLVIGIPDPESGVSVHAVVVGQGLTEQQVIDWTQKKLGSRKAPRSVTFVDSLPLTSAGKPDKKRLRASYWDASTGGGIRLN